MFVIEVVPLQHLPKNVSQILTYYYKTPIIKGAVVEISVQTKKINALVLSSTPIETIKETLKTNTFSLKKINKIVLEKSLVDKSFWEISKFISTYYFDDLTRVLKILLPTNLKSLIKYLSKPSNQKEFIPIKPTILNDFILPTITINSIVNAFNNKKSTLLAFPTQADLDFYLNHFKTILNDSNFVILDKKITTKNLNTWYSDLLESQPKIIFGLRKSLGFPLNNLGLILIFNSNDESYKSWDLRPYFNFENTLKWFSKTNNIEIQFQKNPIELSLLKSLKQTPSTFSTTHILTDPKINIIINKDFNKKDALGYSIKNDFFKLIHKNEKWVLFFNKKGFWNGIKCKACGYIFSCPSCNKPLSYFKTNDVQYLQCNLCNHKYNAFSACPKCKKHDFEPTNIGLDKLEQDLKDMTKEKAIPLFHLESSSTDLETIVNNFNNSKNGILIGTSSILRPQIQNVENTAILNIDNLFGIPDFKTEEKILTLIWKLKSITQNTLYIKTSYKNNQLFDIIKNNDFDNFWNLELKLRKKYSFPPFSQIIVIEFKHPDQKEAKNTLKIYFDKIQKTIEKNNLSEKFILSPINPAFNEKINNQYYWNFKLKMKLEEPFTIKPQDIKMRNQLLKLLPNDFYIDIDPINNL